VENLCIWYNMRFLIRPNNRMENIFLFISIGISFCLFDLSNKAGTVHDLLRVRIRFTILDEWETDLNAGSMYCPSILPIKQTETPIQIEIKRRWFYSLICNVSRTSCRTMRRLSQLDVISPLRNCFLRPPPPPRDKGDLVHRQPLVNSTRITCIFEAFWVTNVR
jgi:hypothetical protein